MRSRGPGVLFATCCLTISDAANLYWDCRYMSLFIVEALSEGKQVSMAAASRRSVDSIVYLSSFNQILILVCSVT